jgi:NADH-quinone oxidoreductase subunit C
MTTEEIGQRLVSAGLRAEFKPTTPDPHLEIAREDLLKISQMLRENPDLAFDSLMCLSGLDYPDRLEVVINLHSFKHRHKITIKVKCPKDDPVIPTVSAIWPTAEWHEREAFDLIGVRFEGHADLRRILLPEDWEGHPLRKDYQPPEKWHEIPVTVQLPMTMDEGN